MSTPYILANKFSDAHTFAQDRLGLERGTYRVVTSPAAISGPRNADLHLVPGWEKRFDFFAMKGALRYTRLNKVEHTDEPVQTPPPSVPDNLQPAGNQLQIADFSEFLIDSRIPNINPIEAFEVPVAREPALDRTDILQALSDEAAAVEDVTPPTEKPKRVRRKRCESCGELVLPDEFDQHVSEHLPEGD